MSDFHPACCAPLREHWPLPIPMPGARLVSTLFQADQLQPGEQELRLELQGGGAPMPWSCELTWHSDLPATDPNAAIAIASTRMVTIA